jgi:predicted helicase
VPELWRREKKLEWLEDRNRIGNIDWSRIIPDARHAWLPPENADEYASMMLIGSRSARSEVNPQTLFNLYSVGVKTNRDEIVYDFDRATLAGRTEAFIDDYNAEVDRFARARGAVDVDSFVKYDRIKWSRDLKLDLQRGRYVSFDECKIRTALFRPFCKMNLYFDRILNEEVYVFPRFFPTPESEVKNRIICSSCVGDRKGFGCLMANLIPGHDLAFEKCQCFPLYVYDEDGTNRRENITDWSLEQFRTHYGDPTITRWDVFHYVYGVLHQPAYRERFAENLKLELPRVPFLDDFRAVADAGRRLADLHVGYERVEPWPLRWVCDQGTPVSFRVEKMRLSKDKSTLVVNDTLSLADIPPEVFSYRLGNRSALEWVVDQYQVSTDKRSGLTTDPNRADDPEAIVRLVERVVRVSVETVQIVAALPGS